MKIDTWVNANNRLEEFDWLNEQFRQKKHFSFLWRDIGLELVDVKGQLGN